MFKKLLLGLGIATFLGAGSLTVVNAQQFGDSTYTAGINVAGDTSTSEGDSIIQVIKNFINWMLGILALIALVILLWGGFKMVTAAGDEGKYKEGFKILKQAGIWLAVIWLSWFVVSIIFWLIGTVSSWA